MSNGTVILKLSIHLLVVSLVSSSSSQLETECEQVCVSKQDCLPHSTEFDTD